MIYFLVLANIQKYCTEREPDRDSESHTHTHTHTHSFLVAEGHEDSCRGCSVGSCGASLSGCRWSLNLAQGGKCCLVLLKRCTWKVPSPGPEGQSEPGSYKDGRLPLPGAPPLDVSPGRAWALTKVRLTSKVSGSVLAPGGWI